MQPCRPRVGASRASRRPWFPFEASRRTMPLGSPSRWVSLSEYLRTQRCRGRAGVGGTRQRRRAAAGGGA
eukprot:3223153-Pleurochrysis_carterae.AAC.1